ncbi:MAG: helix-turn-helix domain-containing protein [Nanoarchaeota archaeon]
MDVRILEDLGFTGGEIKVYLTLLELGNTTTGPIISKSGVARSKVYEILEKLEEKGLVTESIRENTRYFQPSSPNRILDYIKEKETALKEKENNFRKILPGLMKKQKTVLEKQEVKIYAGWEGQKTFYKEALENLKKGDEYLVVTMGNEQWENENGHTFIQNLHQKRLEMKLHVKVLFNSSKGDFKKKKHFPNKPPYFEIRSTPLNLPTSLVIIKDAVSITSWNPTIRNFCIICHDVADQYREFFYDLWKQAKK